ncbi:hypothetical protein DFP72DRAFT_1073220 [Ephemerocybe angulata]|uniref:Uncharacterized protein n=1 Tax=Ephemerocybe angulata TaxID=980116 RepID=A0A8H6HMX1_9AGAR|nr:hypothetical protein DFP72DRAFT_1073220 [Tulosesus angulatus]
MVGIGGAAATRWPDMYHLERFRRGVCPNIGLSRRILLQMSFLRLTFTRALVRPAPISRDANQLTLHSADIYRQPRQIQQHAHRALETPILERTSLETHALRKPQTHITPTQLRPTRTAQSSRDTDPRTTVSRDPCSPKATDAYHADPAASDTHRTELSRHGSPNNCLPRRMLSKSHRRISRRPSRVRHAPHRALETRIPKQLSPETHALRKPQTLTIVCSVLQTDIPPTQPRPTRTAQSSRDTDPRTKVSRDPRSPKPTNSDDRMLRSPDGYHADPAASDTHRTELSRHGSPREGLSRPMLSKSHK